MGLLGEGFPIRGDSKDRKEGSGVLDRFVLIQEAQKLNKLLNNSPQDIGDKKVYNIEGFAKVLRDEAGTKRDERKMGELLFSKGFQNLSNPKGIDFLKKNY